MEKMTDTKNESLSMCQGLMPSYLGGLNEKDHSFRTVQANNLRGQNSKITRVKWTDGMIQVVEHLLCKREALSEFKLQSCKKKK
jgi:hypothetical protein